MACAFVTSGPTYLFTLVLTVIVLPLSELFQRVRAHLAEILCLARAKQHVERHLEESLLSQKLH